MKLTAFTTLIFFMTLNLLGCVTTSSDPSQRLSSTRESRAAHINVQLGLGYLQKGQTARAKKKLLTALKQSPKSAEVNDAMAYFLEATGDKMDADVYYRRAIQLAPKQGAPLNNYGTFLCRSGKYRQADIYFRRAMQDKAYVNLADAYENAGLCALQVRDDQKAEQYFKQALAKEHERPNSLLELAEIAYRKSQVNKAERYLRSFRLVAKATPQSLYLSYRVAKRLHQIQRARDYAAELVARYPESAQARLYQFRGGEKVS